MPKDDIEKVRDSWEKNAAWWDDYVGAEGNTFHRELIAPAQLRFLEVQSGERVLDIACGNGQFAREMARAGASVLAFDFSATFIERAKQHSEKEGSTSIEYRVVDATDERQLRSLGDRDFDAAVCTMALMDIPTIEPLLSTLPSLLRPGGRFVFSVMHPCFNSMGAPLLVEEDVRDGELVTKYAVKGRVLSGRARAARRRHRWAAGTAHLLPSAAARTAGRLLPGRIRDGRYRGAGVQPRIEVGPEPRMAQLQPNPAGAGGADGTPFGLGLSLSGSLSRGPHLRSGARCAGAWDSGG